MVRINYKGSNIGEGTFDEIEIADNSEQVAKRNERYIEDLKTNRDAQTAIDSQYIRDAEAALRRGSTSQEQENKRQIAAAQTIANQQIKSLQAQAKEIESITGRRANITGKGDKKVDSWLEFVTNTSKKAADMYQSVQEKEAEFQWEQGIAKAHMFGATWENVAWDRRWNDAGIISASKEELAAIAEANGADSSYVAQIRDGNKHFMNATKHALAKDMLKASTGVFQTAMQEDAETIIDIRQPDGTSKKVPLNEIDRGDVVQVQQAYYQWLPQHIKKNGFGDASSEFLNDGLQIAKQGYDTLIAGIRQADITRTKAERMEGALKIFHSDKTPISLKGAAVAAQNVDPSLTTKAAYESVIGGMVDLEAFPDASEVDSLLDNTIVAGGATLRQAYGSAVQEMLDKRVDAQRNRYVQNEEARQVEEEGRIDSIKEGVLADRADDGQVNQIDNSQLEEKAIEAEQRGFIKEAAYLRSLQTQTVDGIHKEQLVQTWDKILAEGGYLPPQRIIASGVDDKTQAKYIKAANESIATAVPPESQKFFEKIASKALKNRSGKNYTKDSITSVTVDFATQAAVEQYRLDYAVKLKETGSNQQADTYAQERFFAELKNTEGRYKVPDVTTDGHPYPQFLPKGTQPVDDITATFATKFKEEGGAVYRQPHEDLRPSIDSSLKTLEYSGKFNYPPAINKIAAMSGGKYNSLDVFRMQAEALGIELPESFNQAQQVQSEIGPAYQKYLNYKPSTTRTDIAVIGSGEDPVYRRVIPPAVAQDKEFQAEVNNVAERLGISPNDLYAVMGFETGGTFDPGIRNAAGSGATGLIQFMPSTAKGLGISTDALSRMSRVEQMHYVEKYLATKGVRGGTLSDLYMAVLFPAAVGRGENYVLFGQGAMSGYQGRAYDQNRGLDTNNDGSITKAEASSKVFSYRDKYNAADPWRDKRNLNPAILKHQAKTEVGQ